VNIWALGITLYELLTGTTPSRRNTIGEMLISILRDEPDLESPRGGPSASAAMSGKGPAKTPARYRGRKIPAAQRGAIIATAISHRSVAPMGGRPWHTGPQPARGSLLLVTDAGLIASISSHWELHGKWSADADSVEAH
jgi:serine/threonine protein kinase